MNFVYFCFSAHGGSCKWPKTPFSSMFYGQETIVLFLCLGQCWNRSRTAFQDHADDEKILYYTHTYVCIWQYNIYIYIFAADFVILSDYIIILLHHVRDVICDHVIVWHVLTCYVYKFPKEYTILKYVYKNESIKSWHTISILWKMQVQSDHMFWCPGRRKQEDLDFDDEEEHSDDEDQGPSWHWSRRRNVAFIIFVPFSVSGCFRCLNNKYTNLLFDPCLVRIVGRSLWRKVRRWGRVGWRTLTKKPTLSTWLMQGESRWWIPKCWGVECFAKKWCLPLWYSCLGGIFSYDL